MANYAEEPLCKITVNLFKKDVDWFLEKYPQGWTKVLRKAVREYVSRTESNDRYLKELRDAQ